MINKGHLLLKLRRDNIKISIEELDEIIDIYNHLIDFILLDTSITKEKKYDFIDNDASLHPLNQNDVIDCFYNIFVGIILFKEYNLLGLLDYLLIINRLNNYCAITSQHKIYTISKYIDDILLDYETIYKENFFCNFIYFNEDDIRDYLIEDNALTYQEKLKIPNFYRKIIKTYNEIYNKYYLDYERYDEMGIIEYDYFTCMTYFYFIKNNLIKNDPERVYFFLKELTNNIEDKLDKINLTGLKDNKKVNDYKNIMNYIDSLYNNSKRKIKIIK